MIQYDASTDYNAANIIYNGLKNDYDTLELRGITYYSWSDSNFYNTFSDYEVVVGVGAQGANSLYAWLVSKGLIRNAVESDNGYALVQETTLTVYGKTFKIFAVGSWTEEGTVRSANEALWRFCRDSDFGITYFTKGDVKYIDGNYNHITSNDRCDFSNTDVLEEFYCLDYNSKSSINKACSDYDMIYCDGNVLTIKDYFCNSGMCDYSLSTVNCPNGCQNNACVGCTPPKVPRNGRCEYLCCYNDNLYWCYEGNVQDMKEDCQYGCENNVCKSCPVGKVFRNGRCEYPCCYNNDLYWCWEGNVQDMKEDCQNGCTNNQCNNCTSHSSFSCYNNDVYWYDNCGDREDMKEDCFARCEYGSCCIHHLSSYCYDNDIYWRDSCGNTEEIKENCNSQDTYLSNNQCISINGQRLEDVYRLKRDYYCGDTNCKYTDFYEKVQNCSEGQLCIEGSCKPYKGSDYVCSEDDTAVCHYLSGWSCSIGCSSGCDQGTTLKGHNYAYCHEDRFDVGQFTKGNNCSGCDETWCSYCSDQNTETHCRWDSDYYEQRWVREDKHCDYGCDQSKGICKDTSCHNGVRDYDEEGIDCGGVCDECETTLTILILPFNWNGSFESYKMYVDIIRDYFLAVTPFYDCSWQLKVLSVEDKSYGNGWDKGKCSTWGIPYGGNCIDCVFGLARIDGCAFQYNSETGNKYDFVVGITDQNIGQGNPITGCNYSIAYDYGGWAHPFFTSVIAESFSPSVIAHELGHKFGLADEYCDCGWPFCGTGPFFVNPLSPELGCDPTIPQGSTTGSCCKTTNSDGTPLPYIHPFCNKMCDGNFDRFGIDLDTDGKLDYGTRSIMAGSSFNFDINSYNHLKSLPQFQCKSKKQLSLLFSLFSTLSASEEKNYSESILEINLLINKSDKVKINNISINFGEPLIEKSTGNNYSLRILDQSDNILYRRDFDLYFFVFSDPPLYTNETFIFDRIRYNDSLKKIRLYHNDDLIFSYDLDVCDNNTICDSNENYYSCSVDCDPWAKDGICRAVKDYNCDPDCIENADPDCFKLGLQQGWNLVSYPVILNISTEALLNPIDGKYKVIYTYNSSDSISKWKEFSLTKIDLRYFNFIDNTMGLWVYMNQNGTLEMSGLPSINTNFILKNGWNLISYPSLTELETNEAFNEVSNEIVVVYAFENNEWNSYSPLKNDLLNTLGKLKPGMGLWVNVRNDTKWVFDKGFKKY